MHLEDVGVFLQAPNVFSKTGSLVNTFMFANFPTAANVAVVLDLLQGPSEGCVNRETCLDLNGRFGLFPTCLHTFMSSPMNSSTSSSSSSVQLRHSWWQRLSLEVVHNVIVLSDGVDVCLYFGVIFQGFELRAEEVWALFQRFNVLNLTISAATLPSLQQKTLKLF